MYNIDNNYVGYHDMYDDMYDDVCMHTTNIINVNHICLMP